MKTARKPKIPVALMPLDPTAKLLSLDISSTAIGYCCFFDRKIVEFGKIKSPGGWDSKRRIENNTSQTVELAKRAWGYDNTLSPLWIVIEWQSHKKAAGNPHVQGLATLGQAQGAVWGALYGQGWIAGVDQISERDWTKQGGRNVSKVTRFRQAKLMCSAYCGAVTNDEKYDEGMDVSDAIMLGYWRLSIK